MFIHTCNKSTANCWWLNNTNFQTQCQQTPKYEAFFSDQNNITCTFNRQKQINKNEAKNCNTLRYFNSKQLLRVFLHLLFTFFYMHKKKVLDSRKFSTSGFQRIYMFSDVLNTIWLFFKMSVCLHVCLHNIEDTVSHEQMRGKSRNFIFSCTLIKTGSD